MLTYKARPNIQQHPTQKLRYSMENLKNNHKTYSFIYQIAVKIIGQPNPT